MLAKKRHRQSRHHQRCGEAQGQRVDQEVDAREQGGAAGGVGDGILEDLRLKDVVQVREKWRARTGFGPEQTRLKNSFAVSPSHTSPGRAHPSHRATTRLWRDQHDRVAEVESQQEKTSISEQEMNMIA